MSYDMSIEEVKTNIQGIIKDSLTNINMKTFVSLILGNPSVMDCKLMNFIIVKFISVQNIILKDLEHLKYRFFDEYDYLPLREKANRGDLQMYFNTNDFLDLLFNNNSKDFIFVFDIEMIVRVIHLLNEDVFNYLSINGYLLKYIYDNDKNGDTLLTLCEKLYENIKYNQNDNKSYESFNEKIEYNHFGKNFNYKKILSNFIKTLISLDNKTDINIVKDLLNTDNTSLVK